MQAPYSSTATALALERVEKKYDQAWEREPYTSEKERKKCSQDVSIGQNSKWDR